MYKIGIIVYFFFLLQKNFAQQICYAKTAIRTDTKCTFVLLDTGKLLTAAHCVTPEGGGDVHSIVCDGHSFPFSFDVKRKTPYPTYVSAKGDRMKFAGDDYSVVTTRENSKKIPQIFNREIVMPQNRNEVDSFLENTKEETANVKNMNVIGEDVKAHWDTYTNKKIKSSVTCKAICMDPNQYGTTVDVYITDLTLWHANTNPRNTSKGYFYSEEIARSSNTLSPKCVSGSSGCPLVCKNSYGKLWTIVGVYSGGGTFTYAGSSMIKEVNAVQALKGDLKKQPSVEPPPPKRKPPSTGATIGQVMRCGVYKYQDGSRKNLTDKCSQVEFRQCSNGKGNMVFCIDPLVSGVIKNDTATCVSCTGGRIETKINNCLNADVCSTKAGFKEKTVGN